MRHRARRPLLDLFQRLVVAPRAVVLALAVILVGAASAVALGIYDGAQTPTAGASATEEPETPYDGSEPSLPAETLTGNGPSGSGEPTTSAPTPSDSPTETRDPDDVVSRSASRLPDPVETPEPIQTTVAPEPSAEPSPTPNSPETTATTRQANANRWTVSVSADEDATYECSLDGGGYSPCETTVTYRDLEEGTHTFAARATDGDGNTDPTPARLSTEVTAPGEG
jgi:hypothetical protein